MRAKLDENVPVEAVELFRAAGWLCDTVNDEGLAGADDPTVGAACQAEPRVLFTLDLDFADIRALSAERLRRHRRIATKRTQSAASTRVDNPRASGLVRGMDRASTLDRGAGSCSRSGRERAEV